MNLAQFFNIFFYVLFLMNQHTRIRTTTSTIKIHKYLIQFFHTFFPIYFLKLSHKKNWIFRLFLKFFSMNFHFKILIFPISIKFLVKLQLNPRFTRNFYKYGLTTYEYFFLLIFFLLNVTNNFFFF